MASETHIITFLRHGESVGNAEERFQGQADFPLTDKGRAQAQALADRWLAEAVAFDACISSPLLRAWQTAGILCQAFNLEPEPDPDWMELSNGLLAGLTHVEGDARYPRPPFITPYTRTGRTGESRWELYLRAGRCIQKLVERPAGRYLVVSHGGLLNMVLYAVLSIPPQADFSGPRFIFDNTSYATFNYDPTQHNWRMLAFGDRPRWMNVLLE